MYMVWLQFKEPRWIKANLTQNNQSLFIFYCPLFYSPSHRGQPPCDQCDPRECPAHLLWLHPGWYHFGCRQCADLQANSDSLLLLPAASNHPRHGLLHAKQALLQQLGGHPGFRSSRDVLERRQLGAVAVGVSHGRSHGLERLPYYVISALTVQGCSIMVMVNKGKIVNILDTKKYNLM